MKKQPSYLLCFLLLLGACTQHLSEERILVFIQPDVTSLANVQKLKEISQQKNYVLDTPAQISLLKEDTIKYYSTLRHPRVQAEAEINIDGEGNRREFKTFIASVDTASVKPTSGSTNAMWFSALMKVND